MPSVNGFRAICQARRVVVMPEHDSIVLASDRKQSRRFTLPRRKALVSLYAITAISLGSLFGCTGASAASPEAGWDGVTGPLTWTEFDLVTDDTIVLSVAINGTPGMAILDSGSGASIVGTAFAARLGLQADERKSVRGLSGTAVVRLAKNVEVTIGSISRRLPLVVVADLSAPAAALGRDIDFLLGADFINDAALAIDVGKRQIALMPRGSFAGGGSWRKLPLMEGPRRELLTTVHIDGRPATLMVDTGSASPLMLSLKFVADHQLLKGKPVSTAAIGGVDGMQIAGVFELLRVSLADLAINKITCVVPHHWIVETADGNIGLPLLARFDMVLDPAAQSFWLRFGSASPAMLKDRSGLGIAVENNQLVIVHVAGGSPAARQGLVVGDRIVAVDGKAIDARYGVGNEWRWRYRPAGTTVNLGMYDGRQLWLKLREYY